MESRENVANIAFYKFVPLEDPKALQIFTKEIAQNLKGTILIAPEGVNAMLAGTLKEVETFLEIFKRDRRFSDILVKWSYSNYVPFNRLLVKVKNEILTDRFISEKEMILSGQAPFVTPADLHRALNEHEEIILIDVRNDFEVKYGAFKGAINPEMKTFSQFGPFAKSLDLSKEAKIVTYCTGGIRCEKGTRLLMAAGYKNVFQLEGGILEYLRQTSGEFFEGTCFVFDQREALDRKLKAINPRIGSNTGSNVGSN